MDFSASVESTARRFKTSLVGVSFANADGSSRQQLLQELQPGASLELRREPENEHDRFAIAVHRADGRQLGYLPGGDQRLAHHLDSGGKAMAAVVVVTGGTVSVGVATHGCVVEVSVDEQDLDWKKITPVLDESRKIERLLAKAKMQEDTNPAKAIQSYRAAIDQIVALDQTSTIARHWRRARYPVNPLSRLLEREGRADEALQVMKQYECYSDAFGLTALDEQNLRARAKRLSKVLASKRNEA